MTRFPPGEYKTYELSKVGKQLPTRREGAAALTACQCALDLLRDIPTRHLDAPMRVRLLEVERALVEAIKPETASDAKPKLGDACAAMVAAYDD